MPEAINLNSKRLPPNTVAINESAPFIELRGSIVDVGILKDTILPSFAIHSGLSLVAYGIGRYTNRLEAKDWLWPSAQVFNAWFAAVGRRVIYGGLPLGQALGMLSRPERLTLSFVTIWGGRLFYRIASRSQKRGKDDPRYDVVKKEEGFWNKAFVTQFLPEAAIQTIITLPFTAPYYHQGGVFTGYHPFVQAFAVGLFSAGIFLETMADYQLDQYQETSKSTVEVHKEGVWSLVRHPNYLGDALIHFSFPVLLFASDMLAPIELLGPIVNYIYLRKIGGDKQKEEHQAAKYEGEKKADFESHRQDATMNSFWPDLQQFTNKWLWITVGAGVLGAGIEQIVHQMGLD